MFCLLFDAMLLCCLSYDRFVLVVCYLLCFVFLSVFVCIFSVFFFFYASGDPGVLPSFPTGPFPNFVAFLGPTGDFRRPLSAGCLP